MDIIHNIARGVCIKDKNILLAYFKEGEYYFLPGGHIEYEESMLETIRREFLEEAKIIVEPKEFLGIFEHLWINKNKTQHEINFIFLVETSAIHKIQSQEDHLEFRWIPITEIGIIHFLPKEMAEIIKAVVVNKKNTHFNTTIQTKNYLTRLS